MDSETIDTLLAAMEPTPVGFQTTLPPGIQFLGMPVRLVVDTKQVPSHPDRPFEGDFVTLSRFVLERIEALLPRAEAAYRAYHAEYPEYIKEASDPHVWLDVETIEDVSPTQWSFIVGVNPQPDYGTHIVFEGDEVIDCWSGD